MIFLRYILAMFVLTTLLTRYAHTAVHAAELSAAPEGSFSVVVIPDTQHYRGPQKTGQKTKAKPGPVSNPTFAAWTGWIAANLDRQRIVFVSHVGDIVDKNDRAQWAVARNCMNLLHGKVPYGISVGNHDMVSKSGDSSLFQEVFGSSRFESFDWYGGSFHNASGKQQTSGNNANSVQLFEAAGLKFVALHLECNAPDEVLAWASQVLEKYSDRRAMITTHMGLGPLKKPKKSRGYFDDPKGRMEWKKCHGKRGNSPRKMWEKCFRNHKNLFLVCCGDQSRTQAMRQKSIGKRGNTVHELLSDYGVNGLRVMRFTPAENQIEVITWDPLQEQRCETTRFVSDRAQHQFTLDYSMSLTTAETRAE